MKTPDNSFKGTAKSALTSEEIEQINKEVSIRGGYVLDSMPTDQEAFYDVRADIYDQQNDIPSRIERRKIMNDFYHAELQRLIAGKDLSYLDFGCATGGATNEFLEGLKVYSSVAKGYAVDISEEMVKRASKALAEFKVVKGGADQIDFDGTLDLVTSFFHVLCHLKDAELELFFENVSRSLKPGGILCFDVIKRFDIGERGYSKEHMEGGKKYLVYHSTKKDGSKVTGADGQPIIGTDRMFSKEEIIDFAERANLEVVKIEEILIVNADTKFGSLKEYAVILKK